MGEKCHSSSKMGVASFLEILRKVGGPNKHWFCWKFQRKRGIRVEGVSGVSLVRWGREKPVWDTGIYRSFEQSLMPHTCHDGRKVVNISFFVCPCL